MSDRAAVVAYLMPPVGSMWLWSDEGRNLAWRTGQTIAFRPEVHAVARRLAVGGLPPFAAIILLLAATRDGWHSSAANLLSHAKALSLASTGGGGHGAAADVALSAIAQRIECDTENLITSLNRVATLPNDLRQTLEAKAVLAEIAFENAERPIAPEVAARVVEELEFVADPAFDLGRPQGTAIRELIDSVSSLQPGLQEIDAEHVRLRLRTGLDQLVKSPREDLGPAALARQLLSEIADDPELGGLSRVAHNLLAAVFVPRSLHRHEHLPNGGVSDLSNHGQLDRLLISELANDDLTLAVRVAVNEALYLQREQPPRDPPHSRALLVDAGIRTWGVPRVYTTAAALALTATGDAQGNLSAFRPNGEAVTPIDLATRDGLLAHLESLDTRPHFGASLQAFVNAISTAAEPTEVFLITQEDVLEDPAFCAALHKLNKFSGYAATVARDGTFRLWSLSAAGRSLIRQAKLDLEQLLAPPKARPRPVPALIDASSDLPIILSLNPFPLLLPPASAPREVAWTDQGLTAALTRHRHLLLWKKGEGARVLSDQMPIGRVDLFKFTDDEMAVVSLFTHARHSAHPCTLCIADVDLGLQPPKSLLGIDWSVRGAILREKTLFIIGWGTKVNAYNLHSAEPVATTTQQWHWVRGRVFRAGRSLSLLSLNGSKITFEEIADITADPIMPFEINGFEGPLVMMRDGEIRSLSSPNHIVRPGIKEEVAFESVTLDGRALIVQTKRKNQRYYLDFQSKAGWQPTPHSLPELLKGTARFPKPWRDGMLRKHFLGAFVDLKGTLSLSVSGGKMVEIKFDGTKILLGQNDFARLDDGKRVHPFVRTRTRTGTYRLHAAAWGGRNQVFLDSRGLLHLKSANRNIPEITLVLQNDGALAAWSSDGHVYGPKFFHGSDTSSDARRLHELISRFTKELG